MAGARAIGPQLGFLRLDHAVEEQRLDPHVVVEVLEVPEVRDRAKSVRGELRCAVPRDVEPVPGRKACNLQQPGDPPAARYIRLEAVDAADEVPEVRRDVRVLAGCNLEPRRSCVADEPQPLEVVRGDGLLEPLHVPRLRVALRPRERLLACERAVRVDEELDVVADCLARRVEPDGVALRLAPDLHLHARNAGVGPAAELRAKPVVGIGTEAAAAVDRDVVVRGAEEDDERYAEQAGLQVPQRLVDGGHGAEADSRLAGVADLRAHPQPCSADVHRVLALDGS